MIILAETQGWVIEEWSKSKERQIVQDGDDLGTFTGSVEGVRGERES